MAWWMPSRNTPYHFRYSVHPTGNGGAGIRVTHIVRSLHPRLGGLSLVPTRLAIAQALCGARVRLVTYTEEGSNGRGESLLSGVPGVERIEIVYLPAASAWERITARRAARAFSIHLSDTDVVHVHGAWDPICRAAGLVGQQMSIPYVITPHGMLDPWMLSQKRRKKSLAMRFGYRDFFDGACFLHALNRTEAASFARLRLKPPAETIPNGIFLEEIDPLPPQGLFRSQHPQLGCEPFVLFLGRLHLVKGLDYLIDAFAMLSPEHGHVRLAVVGPDEGQQGMIERRANARGIGDRVHFLGPVYGSARYAAMVDACCYCLPSRHEGFSIATTEALACGVPVVVSQQANFPEVATSHAGRVVPLEAAALGRALDDVLRDAEMRQEMSKNGRRLVRDRFTWQGIAQQMLLAYRRHTTDHFRPRTRQAA